MRVAKNEVVMLSVKHLFLSVCSPETDPEIRVQTQVLYLEWVPVVEWGSDLGKRMQLMNFQY